MGRHLQLLSYMHQACHASAVRVQYLHSTGPLYDLIVISTGLNFDSNASCVSLHAATSHLRSWLTWTQPEIECKDQRDHRAVLQAVCCTLHKFQGTVSPTDCALAASACMMNSATVCRHQPWLQRSLGCRQTFSVTQIAVHGPLWTCLLS